MEKGVSVGGHKNVPRSIHGREMASATNSVRSVRHRTINVPSISDCVSISECVKVCRYVYTFECAIMRAYMHARN